MNACSNWPAIRADRHATAMIHDSAGCRIVAFTLAPGQVVPEHTSASSVIVTVLDGAGSFTGAQEERMLQGGESASYAPHEPHGMKAGANGLRFLAIITPSPSAGT